MTHAEIHFHEVDGAVTDSTIADPSPELQAVVLSVLLSGVLVDACSADDWSPAVLRCWRTLRRHDPEAFRQLARDLDGGHRRLLDHLESRLNDPLGEGDVTASTTDASATGHRAEVAACMLELVADGSDRS